MPPNSNFDFLNEHDPVFFQLGSAAERAFSGDPNTTVIKLRQLAEALAQDLAARSDIQFDETTKQADLLLNIQDIHRICCGRLGLFFHKGAECKASG